MVLSQEAATSGDGSAVKPNQRVSDDGSVVKVEAKPNRKVFTSRPINRLNKIPDDILNDPVSKP